MPPGTTIDRVVIRAGTIAVDGGEEFGADDLYVVAAPRYGDICPSQSANSTGEVGRIFTVGTTSVAENDLMVCADRLPTFERLPVRLELAWLRRLPRWWQRQLVPRR